MIGSRRTLLGIALFVPMAAILLSTFACLPAPVGHPETSKVDNALSGTYLAVGGAPDSTSIVFLQPWDKRTYHLQMLKVEKKEGKESRTMMECKAWLTDIGGKTFMTAEPVEADFDFVSGDRPVATWMVMRIDKIPTGLVATDINGDSAIMKDLKTRAQIEAAIKANVTDNAIYAQPMTFKKLGKDDEKMVDGIRAKFSGEGAK